MNFFSIFKRNLIYKFKNKISIDSKKVEYKSLDELFHYYGSDKANIFRIKNSKGHGFSKFYENYLLGLRNKKLKILEVGSYAGALRVLQLHSRCKNHMFRYKYFKF